MIAVPLDGAVGFCFSNPALVPGYSAGLAADVEVLVRNLAALDARTCGPRLAPLVRRAKLLVVKQHAIAKAIDVTFAPAQPPPATASDDKIFAW